MWSIENHDCSPKLMPKLHSPKQLPSVIFFAFLFSPCTREAVKCMCKILRAFQKARERLNRSSERKVMPVLRRTLRVRFLWWHWWIRCESGGMKIWSGGSGQRGSHNWTKTWSKPATKTRTRTQTQHYELWKRIMQKAKHGFRTGKT
jgi:hypothetical protein